MNFEKLSRYMNTLQDKGIPGCDIVVWQNHREIFRYMCGEREPGVPMRGDELCWLYSATKVFTMTCAMQLVEQGKLSLTAPVADVLPAFSHMTVRDGDVIRPARTTMTLEHLMSMQGGLNYQTNVPPVLECREKYGVNATTRQIIDALAQNPLDFDPGTRYQYSLCHDVVAAMVEAVSGMTFSQYVQKHIIEPLEIEDLGFRPSAEQLARFSACYRWNEEKQQSLETDRTYNMYRFLSERYDSGGAGLFGGVTGYIRLADALANEGMGCTGAKILSQASIDEMRRDRLCNIREKKFIPFQRPGYGYGLGVRTLIDPTPSRSPVGEFGWDGAAGAYVLIDPTNRLSAFYVQNVLGYTRTYYDYHPAIRDCIYEGLEA